MTTFFGTDGIRSKVGTELLQQHTLPVVGQTIALWAHQKYGAQPRILIAHDTRTSCAYIKSGLKSGLLLHNIIVYDAGVLSTPAAYHIIRTQKNFDAALVISASHNPYYDNGIKLIDKTTGKLSSTDERIISTLLMEHTTQHFTYDFFGTDVPLPEARALYKEQILALFPAHFLRGLRIVLDTAHGATYACAPDIFTQLGAEVIAINNTPNGTNINHQSGALHLESLQQAVITHTAHIGFAFDGDGDRVMAVNKHGAIKNGDDILALLTTHPTYQNSNTIVGTIMSNYGFEQFLITHNKQLLRTPVGDKYIAEQLQKNNLILGGEQSGHIILHDILNTGDGILVALKIIETLLYTNNWDFVTFDKYPQVLINVPVSCRKDLESEPLATIIAHAQSSLSAGRLVVRFSGTELLLRVMVEAASHTDAETIAYSIAHTLEKKLKELA